MQTMTDLGIPLTSAAHRLGRRYRATLDLVLTGKLRGHQDEGTGRWFVEPDSLAQFLDASGGRAR